MQLPADKYELYEQMILSDQISPVDLAQIFEANPVFADWYRERAANRWRERGTQRQAVNDN